MFLWRPTAPPSSPPITANCPLAIWALTGSSADTHNLNRQGPAGAIHRPLRPAQPIVHAAASVWSDMASAQKQQKARSCHHCPTVVSCLPAGR